MAPSRHATALLTQARSTTGTDRLPPPPLLLATKRSAFAFAFPRRSVPPSLSSSSLGTLQQSAAASRSTSARRRRCAPDGTGLELEDDEDDDAAEDDDATMAEASKARTRSGFVLDTPKPSALRSATARGSSTRERGGEVGGGLVVRSLHEGSCGRVRAAVPSLAVRLRHALLPARCASRGRGDGEERGARSKQVFIPQLSRQPVSLPPRGLGCVVPYAPIELAFAALLRARHAGMVQSRWREGEIIRRARCAALRVRIS